MIQFTLRKIIDNMQNANFNHEDLDDKVAKAIELSKKKAEKKKQEKKEVAGGTLKTKKKSLAQGRAAKQGVGTFAPIQSSLKHHHLVDENELRNSPTGTCGS